MTTAGVQILSDPEIEKLVTTIEAEKSAANEQEKKDKA